MTLKITMMARRLELEITESVEYLDKTLKNTRSASHKERLQMLWWLKIGQVRSHCELAKRLARDSSTMPSAKLHLNVLSL